MLLTEKIIRDLVRRQILDERAVFSYSGPSGWGRSATRQQSCVIAAGGESAIVDAIQRLCKEIKDKNSSFTMVKGTNSNGNPDVGRQNISVTDFEGKEITDAEGTSRKKSVIKWNIKINPAENSIYVVQKDSKSGAISPIIMSAKTNKPVESTSWVKSHGFEGKIKALYIEVNGMEETCSASQRQAAKEGYPLAGDEGDGSFTTGVVPYEKGGRQHRGFKFVLSNLEAAILTKMKTYIKMNQLTLKRTGAKNWNVTIPDEDDIDIRRSRGSYADGSILTMNAPDIKQNKIVKNSNTAREAINGLSERANPSAFLRVLIQTIKDNSSIQSQGSASIVF